MEIRVHCPRKELEKAPSASTGPWQVDTKGVDHRRTLAVDATSRSAKWKEKPSMGEMFVVFTV
jgi:hypothetical protein